MSSRPPERLHEIAGTDDFHIAPFRADGSTPGTLTWIWSVVVDGGVYVRACHGTGSRWYGSATTQRAGVISAAGRQSEVIFSPVTEAGLKDRIDAAHRTRYADSAYLPPMISDRTRAATVRVDPRT